MHVLYDWFGLKYPAPQAEQVSPSESWPTGHWSHPSIETFNFQPLIHLVNANVEHIPFDGHGIHLLNNVEGRYLPTAHEVHESLFAADSVPKVH